LIYKNKNNSTITGTKWHKDLVESIFEMNIFREELKILLEDYMQFRHFVRHTYGFQLKWDKMKILFFDMKIIWEKLKEDLMEYLNNNETNPLKR